MWRPLFCWGGKPSKPNSWELWEGYVGVLLWLIEMKYVSGYRGGVR